ncbi:DUF5590 domain-containing protein [Bacillus sp. S/N-304-OC-R1]|uniref:cell wall elongation regulator TseB-like domain-containing protein n=1 Tax=Bacillus sp. S/N-304-OC-R1 TaxID=2758034 RepID=UPI001C8D0782|nr:DUF5590 domain-containing protein [Bacillus sp. S/N-304-OC-R1]MBY0122619.1 DUF5590 domain-containing protein [Bacillus sp. S/N-304-OC-R1]
MKKVIIICLLIFSVILVSGIIVYQNAVKPLKAAETIAIERAMKETRLEKAKDFKVYHGQETYYIVKGKNRSGTNIYVWIPEKEGQIIVRKVSDGVSKEDAINKLKEEKHPKEIISVRLGMEKNIPLWEIYYRTDGDLINYYYVDFKSGEWLKKIENL